jgi:AcrR family transcriptional regulator
MPSLVLDPQELRALEEPGRRCVTSAGSSARVQQERVVRALVEVIVERGWASASVGLVVARAKLSRRTFYELFPGGLEDCLLAVLDQTARRVNALALERLERAGSWQEGVREALAALLLFFDSEPALARVCLVEALGGGQIVAQRREAAVAAFRESIVVYVEREAGQEVPPLAAESVIASVMGIIYTRLLAGGEAALIGLLGPLMGAVVAPFAAGEQMIAEETRRGDELARAIQAGEDSSWASGSTPQAKIEPALSGVPALLANPSARRARQCLLYIGEQSRRGRHPSNREIAAGIGIQSKAQISRLLAQLCAESMIAKRSGGVGAPNAWSLTERGAAVARALAEL